MTAISHSYTEQTPAISLGNMFTLTDTDGPMNYTSGVNVTMSLIRDEGEELLLFTLTGNISVTSETEENEGDYYTTVFELTNGRNFEDYLEVN